ncbi:flagellar hook-basal body complex protein FliE [Yersinia enterocolitica]|uniref:flagellar hook-basal body complex protein FliE n=1 Tax=Yersinia TaxID=629 RepID=UPI00110E35E7|nr:MULTISPECIES: flagellar hook-basal body complex protein FliE [Yersinia]EKN3445605.1 flagellar hook-basal body complex protein FliE [Yersinia enterocolitica]EKN4798789.1 flagellar hook-basal body complex protein FliE [Yersinia enterocolitica]QDW32103.1 flagellar hook-basal body complex protein FliE [Yersinia sp. KBS0713]
MSIQSISGVLEQINFQAQQVSNTQRSPFISDRQGIEKPLQFSDVLFSSVNSINEIQTQAKSQSQDYLTGATDIGLNDVMVSLQKSSLALNLGVQVRNKLVSAYQEVMNMSV